MHDRGNIFFHRIVAGQGTEANANLVRSWREKPSLCCSVRATAERHRVVTLSAFAYPTQRRLAKLPCVVRVFCVPGGWTGTGCSTRLPRARSSKRTLITLTEDAEWLFRFSRVLSHLCMLDERLCRLIIDDAIRRYEMLRR